MAATGNDTGIVWTFRAGSYLIALTVTPDPYYQYDGDDDGETQAKLDAGEYVAFDSHMRVIDNSGAVIGSDDLGGSVYACDSIADFWTAHRDPNPAHRNSSANPMRRTSPHVVIGHYFPDMVRNAVDEARRFLRAVQARHVRAA